MNADSSVACDCSKRSVSFIIYSPLALPCTANKPTTYRNSSRLHYGL